MRTLDETDIHILQLLIEDARRPYSDIAEQVDVSPPTVSDRIDRLSDLGIIEGFTVDIDRATVTTGTEVLIDLDLEATVDDRVTERFAAVDQVEHVFVTADAKLIAVATVAPEQVRELLSEAVDLELVASYRVHLLEDRRWAPSVGGVELALTCEVCETTVDTDGVSLRQNDDLYHFCDPDCRSTFETRQRHLAESA